MSGAGPAAREQVATERAAAFRTGFADILEAAPGLAAWGLVTGVAMVQSGLPLHQALGLSILAYAASAQLAALPLLVAGAPGWVIVLTALLMNLRFVIYSALLRDSLAHLSFGRRVLYGYLTGDFIVAMYQRRLRQRPDWPARDAYFLGLALPNILLWHLASFAGIFGAAFVPRDWGLELAGTLALLALLIPLLGGAAGLAGAGVAALVGVLAHPWPLRLGLVAATICGVLAAVAVDRATAAVGRTRGARP